MIRPPDVDSSLLAEVVRDALPSGGPWLIARPASGVSTQVYELGGAGQTLYLRVAESPLASLAPELEVHRRLLALGVRVPEVVHFEPFNELLGRSFMVTTAIPGSPIDKGLSARAVAAILHDAGRDLALINSVPVSGFGWIRRDDGSVGELRAESPSHDVFLDRFAADLHAVKDLFPRGERRSILAAVAQHRGLLSVTDARLAHGDFDAASIFQLDGRYSGVIDFGEIRGAHPLYDIGHFHLHDGERLPGLFLLRLLEGYREAASLPDDPLATATGLALIIGVSRLTATMRRPVTSYQAFLLSAIRRVLLA